MGQRMFVVVGAGLGGLAVALRLSHRGHRVTVLEKTGQVGGRNRRVRVGACDFDGGPTLMMMLDPFRKLFTDVGERIEDHLDLRLCDPSYRVFYADGTTVEGTPDRGRMRENIRALAGDRDADRYPRLLDDLKSLYDDAIPNFVRRNFDRITDFAGPRQLGMVLRHHMLANLARRVEQYADDPRVRMLYSFQTMYLGMSPYDAPWVYAVLTYMEYGEGIWYPMGGMVRIGEVIAELAERRGAEIRLNAPVVRVESGAVTLATGERIEADAVVCNADLPYAEETLTGDRPTGSRDPRRYSCSAHMMYIDYEGELDGLLHHNVFFGPDFKGNLDSLFHEPLGLPDDPAFYACLTNRTDPAKAPPGRENLYVLVPVPNLDRPLTAAEEERLHARVFERLCQAGGFDRAGIRAMEVYRPRDWADELNLARGAAFGLSHDFLQSAFFRPSNASASDPKLFYVGASTQPGNGLPMVLISAELAEERLIRAGLL